MRRLLTAFVTILALSALDATPMHAQTDAAEVSFWESVRDSDQPQELEAYLKAYPDGKFAPLARMRIEQLKGTGTSEAAEAEPATSSPPPIHDCDRLAASPHDPDKVADGVDYGELVPEKAVDACRSAMTSHPGVARFEFQLGRALYEAGSHREAFEQHQKAADKGYASAMGDLGFMYANGKGVAQDDKQAVEWWRKAADKGFAPAMTKLGVMYRYGKGVAQDDKQAVEWYRKAADKGNTPAMFNLGLRYEMGEVVAQDDKQAVEWYRKAADKGNAGAMTKLGFMYENGRGVAQNNKQAVEWYRKAADKGDTGAMNNLGLLYNNGAGVPRDSEQAARQLLEAYRGGSSAAKQNLEEQSSGLTVETRRAIQRQLREAGVYSGAIDGRFGPGTKRALNALALAQPAAESAKASPAASVNAQPDNEAAAPDLDLDDLNDLSTLD